MVESDSPSGKSKGRRSQRVQKILDEVLRRRAAGEALPDEAVIASHGELMPELAERLKALKLIEDAGRQVGEGDEAAAPERGGDASRRFEGECPHCQNRSRTVRTAGGPREAGRAGGCGASGAGGSSWPKGRRRSLGRR